jgi:hypothetical protein
VQRARWVILAVLPLACIAGALVNRYVIHTQAITRASWGAGAMGGSAVWVYLATPVFASYRRQARREFRDNLLLGIAQAELRQAEAIATAGDASDYGSLWVVTQRRLDYYHKIATGQAERSFRYAQLAAFTGFSVLVICAIIAGFARSTSAAVVSGAAGTVAAALSAYIGRTFMRMQHEASTQLQGYFRQPLDFARILTAERIASSLSGDARDTALASIIQSIVAVSPSDTSSAIVAST